MLRRQSGRVFDTAFQKSQSQGGLPFVPIITDTDAAFMLLVPDGTQLNISYGRPAEIVDRVITPRHPYYIFDIEDGSATLGMRPWDGEQRVAAENRFCLTTTEVCNVALHTGVLSRHSLYANASRYENDMVPDVYLEEGKLRLGWAALNERFDEWGSPSCGYRLIPTHP
jgi:hypothetical protein